MAKEKFNIDTILAHRSDELNIGLGVSLGHSVSQGDLSEGQWIRFLRSFLPHRYDVSKGFVFDSKGGVSEQIDIIVFFQVTDPKLYAYGVQDPVCAIEYLSATTLRNIIGDLDLDATLTSRDIINEKMRKILDEATDPWGIKVNRVEVKNILPPKDIREAMERQMRAEREKREKVLLAEAQKQSAILVAEGNKESMILNAEAEKESTIRKAEGEAQKLLDMKKAEAEGIRLIREAEAEGIKMIREAKPDNAVLTIKGYEALGKVADGKATKIFAPANLANVGSLATAVAEAVKKTEE